jgi:hypothetical protein
MDSNLKLKGRCNQEGIDWTTKLMLERNSSQEMARASKRRTGIRRQKKDGLKQGRKKKEIKVQ